MLGRRKDMQLDPEALYLAENEIHPGDCRDLLVHVAPGSVALSVWSPPYFVGKDYESHLEYEDWVELLRSVVKIHADILKPGGFCAINIADILAFEDPALPRYQADVVSGKRSPVTREMVIEAKERHPHFNRYQLAELLGCSEQTIQRRLDHNNVRGGKTATQTRVLPVAGLIDEFARAAGLVLYDRRVWVKDPAWANSRWHSTSFRSVDETEYIFLLWRPGITRVDRSRLARHEWAEWGSRGVWSFRSVRANNVHEAMFPEEFPARLIRMLTDPGELVLDPFIGSGTTALAALRLGRRFIGIDYHDEYVNLARQRLAQAQDPATAAESDSSGDGVA